MVEGMCAVSETELKASRVSQCPQSNLLSWLCAQLLRPKSHDFAG